jgi:hypothetical protein
VIPGRHYRVEHPKEADNWRSSLVVFLIFLPFLIHAVIYLNILVQLIFVRNAVVYPEGANVYASLWALRTGKLYANPLDFPFDVQAYGPVFYLTGLVFAKMTHGDPMFIFRLWRVLSFLSFIGSAGLIGYMCWKLEARKYFATVAAGLCLACAWSIPWAASVRPDTFSMFLSLSGLTVYMMAQGRRRLIFIAAVLATLSFLTKQNTAPVLLAMFIDTLLARRFRETIALAAGCLPVPVTIVSALWLRHEAFLANFLALRHMPLDWSLVLHTIGVGLRTNEIAVIPFFLALLGCRLRWREDRYRPILLAVSFTCLSNVAALANIGGNTNYFTTPWMMMVLLVPVGLIKLEEWNRRSVLVPAGLVLLSGFLLIRQWNLLPAREIIPGDLDTTNLNKVKMLSDSAYLELHTRQPQLLDPFYYHILSLQNLWSSAPIVRQIDNEEYDLILMSGRDGRMPSEFYAGGYHGISFWGTEMLEPIVGHYRALCEVPGVMAFVLSPCTTRILSVSSGNLAIRRAEFRNRLPVNGESESGRLTGQ